MIKTLDDGFAQTFWKQKIRKHIFTGFEIEFSELTQILFAGKSSFIDALLLIRI